MRNQSRVPANREHSQGKRLLLKAALLDHGGDMKPCNIGMAVVSEKRTTYVPFGFTAAWPGVGTVYSRPSLVRTVNGEKGVLCNNSLMRGIMAAAYSKATDASMKENPVTRSAVT